MRMFPLEPDLLPSMHHESLPFLKHLNNKIEEFGQGIRACQEIAKEQVLEKGLKVKK